MHIWINQNPLNMAYLEGYDRKQVTLFQQCIDELILGDSGIRIIDALIDGMNLADLGFLLGKCAEESLPGYLPAVFTKFQIFGN